MMKTAQQAVGNTRLSRMLEADIQPKLMVGDSEDPYEKKADEVATQVTSQTNGKGVMKLQRSPLRTSPPRIQRLRARGLVSAELREIRTNLAWFRRQLDNLENDRVITTEEADRFREQIDSFLSESEELGETRTATREEARRIWLRGREILRSAENVRSMRRGLRRRAEGGRSTRDLKLISDFQITPPVIRINEGEAARISFTLRRPAQSIAWFILSRENEEGTSHRFFRVANNDPGYKAAIWNGTWEGSANQPPETGTYRVHLMVIGADGRREEVFDQIRVENPDDQVVHPRPASGYALQSLRFDGSFAELTDANGNTIRLRAVSGLRPDNPRNPDGTDYTQPRHQWVRDRGPIPEGDYTIRANSVQRPEMRRGALRYPTQRATAAAWGPYRIPLYPTERGNRSQFFFHLDVNNDGTAGCIGIHPGDVGKFNNVVSLLSQMPDDLPVHVSY